MDQIDAFIDDSRALIGKEAVDVPTYVEIAHLQFIYGFAAALGDSNPLYLDADYAAKTKYGCLLAPPTFLAAVRTFASRGTFINKDYGLADFITSAAFEWFDVIRIMDQFKSEVKLREVSEKSGIFFVKEKRAAVLTSTASYWNHHGEIVGKCRGEVTMIPIERGKEMLVDRDIHVYSDEEIQKIKDGLDSEAPPRSTKRRYWENVEVGEQLQTLVKGPLNHMDLCSWYFFAVDIVPLGDLSYWSLKKKPGLVRTNPTTNWPYWDADQEHECFWTCKLRGMPGPFARGLNVAALAGHIVTNWMGDDGFFRKLSVEKLKPFIYGDTMWLTGEVIDKYKERIGEEVYRAVDLKIEGTNQLKERILSGTAITYLPDPGHAVKLPISHQE